MAVLNVKYAISEEEVAKLCAGLYTRSGDAIKDNLNASKIFKHLKEIDWDIEKDKALKQAEVPVKNFSWLLGLLKTPVGITICIALSVISLGIFAFVMLRKKKKEREAEVQAAYHKLNKAILKYVGAISEGKANHKIIKAVIDATNELVEMKKSKKYKVSFDDEQISTLLEICKKYTAELAETKGIELNPPKAKNNTDAKVVVVSWYLGQQANMLKKAV